MKKNGKNNKKDKDNKTKTNNNKDIRRWSEIKNRRKSTKENNLFSFFQRPEYFDDKKNVNDSS